jgi:hypothetical protein
MNTLVKKPETSTELRATPVVKDKFWIVEEDGNKIGTIQAINEGGYAYVHNEQRDQYPSIRVLKNKLNIVFDRARKIKQQQETDAVYGWPCNTSPYNQLYDVSRKLPIYTKKIKSKSYFCAGYYMIRFNNVWTKEFCPKLITLHRYEFAGPYHTKEQVEEQLRIANG